MATMERTPPIGLLSLAHKFALNPGGTWMQGLELSGESGSVMFLW
jgi:hypothetical protein